MNLDVHEVAVGPQRPQGPIAEAGRQDLLGAGSAFSFDEAPRESARGGHFLAIVDRQREKVRAFAGGTRHARGQDHRFPESRHTGAVGLLGDPSGFEDEFAAVSEIGFNTVRLGHGTSQDGVRIHGGGRRRERRKAGIPPPWWNFRLSSVSRPSALRDRYLKNKRPGSHTETQAGFGTSSGS